jgi:hypothetical protein
VSNPELTAQAGDRLRLGPAFRPKTVIDGGGGEPARKRRLG